MIKVFKYQFAKSNSAVYQEIENFRKEVTKIHILQDKTGFQKYQVSFTAIAKLMAANFSILISTNLDQNLSKAMMKALPISCSFTCFGNYYI